jgi:hypothetical protein
MSETPLTKKLGIKPGCRLLILNAPAGYLHMLDPLPGGAVVQVANSGQYDFVQCFVHSQADIERYAPVAIPAVKSEGLLWFSYPKISSHVKTDVTRDSGWERLKREGLRPVTQIAIDNIWSALRFRPANQVRSAKKE